MRLGLLADVHANAKGLECVLDSASREGVDALLIAGDLVGYYYSPLASIVLLDGWKKYMVRGNHEEMLCRSRNDPEYLADVGRRYGSGLKEAICQLPESVLDKLCGLPHPLPLELDGRRILLCHGAPHDPDCYLYPDSDLLPLASLVQADYDLVVTGHTHYPMLRRLGEKTLLVNPGSVGQPRNRMPGAHWALYDTESDEVAFFCEHYDYEPLQTEARKRHPELPYLADVLGRT